MSRNQLIIFGSTVAVIVVAVIVYFMAFSGSNDAAATQVSGVTIVPTDRTLGSPKAPVVVIEYAAPSCPHCAHYNAEVIPLLKKNYIDTGKVFYVFRVFPISPLDGAAEGMARCVPADNYFAFIDLLFRNQKQWDQPEYPDSVPDAHAGLVKMGRIGGLAPEKIDGCMTDKANADRVNQSAKDAMTRYNISGTPTLVINGVVQPSGQVPWPTLKTTLDSFLSKK